MSRRIFSSSDSHLFEVKLKITFNNLQRIQCFKIWKQGVEHPDLDTIVSKAPYAERLRPSNILSPIDTSQKAAYLYTLRVLCELSSINPLHVFEMVLIAHPSLSFRDILKYTELEAIWEGFESISEVNHLIVKKMIDGLLFFNLIDKRKISSFADVYTFFYSIFRLQ